MCLWVNKYKIIYIFLFQKSISSHNSILESQQCVAHKDYKLQHIGTCVAGLQMMSPSCKNSQCQYSRGNTDTIRVHDSNKSYPNEMQKKPALKKYNCLATNTCNNDLNVMNDTSQLCHSFERSSDRQKNLVAAANKYNKLIISGMDSHACDECGKAFGSKIYLIKHKCIVHNNVKQFSCDKCDKSFKSLSGLVYHKKMHTGLLRYKCEECKKGFKKKCLLVRHKRVHL